MKRAKQAQEFEAGRNSYVMKSYDEGDPSFLIGWISSFSLLKCTCFMLNSRLRFTSQELE